MNSPLEVDEVTSASKLPGVVDRIYSVAIEFMAACFFKVNSGEKSTSIFFKSLPSGKLRSSVKGWHG